MQNLKWFDPYKPRLPRIVKRVKRRFWRFYIPTLLLLIISIYPLNWSFYEHTLNNYGTDSARIALIYGIFVLQHITVILGLAEVFALLLVAHDLRRHMKRFWLVFLGTILLLGGTPFIILYAPIGFAKKKLWERRLVRRLISRKKRKAPTIQQLIIADPKLAHEHFVNGHMYLRGENNHRKDITHATYEFIKAVSYGHYLASFHLAKIYAGLEKDFNLKPNYVLAEKYALNCLLAHSLKDDELGRLYYLYGNIIEEAANVVAFNDHDIALLLFDVYTKAQLLQYEPASEKLALLHEQYATLNKEDLQRALALEPFTYLINEFEEDMRKVKAPLVQTPLERLI